MDNRASSGGAPLLAVAAVVLLIAADLPLGGGQAALGSEAIRLGRLLDEEQAALQGILHRAWGEAPAGEEPLTRGRWASHEAWRLLEDRSAARLDGHAAVNFEGEIRVAIAHGPLADVEVVARGILRAVHGPSAVERVVAERVVDPSHALVRSVVDDLVFGGIEDGNSRPGMAFRSALASELSGVANWTAASAERAVTTALAAAARAAEASLGLHRAPAAVADTGPVPLQSADPAEVVRSLEPSSLLAFLRSSCERGPCPVAADALLDSVGAFPATLRAIAEHVAQHLTTSWVPFSIAGSALQALVEAARGFLERCVESLSMRVDQAWIQWWQWNEGRSPPAAAEAPVHIRYAASGVSVRPQRILGPAVSGEETALPFDVELEVAFDLETVVSLPLPESAKFTGEDLRRIELWMTVPLRSGASVALPITWRAAALAGLPLASTIAYVLPYLDVAQEWAAEVGARYARLRDSVADRVAQELAATLSRLVFRVIDAAVEGDEPRAARALFELLRGIFADDLRDALTVNFTAYGRNFSLVPDPLRKQVTLEHREGPHTFGVRLRHMGKANNPLDGRYADYFSLALEVLWSYRKGDLSADLVLDPFLRTGDGLVRFSLVSRGGRGLALDLVAPKVTRVAQLIEVSLSKVLPGGVPFLVTPSGGLLQFDLQARAEFLEVRRTTVLRWLREALEAAWIDVVAGLSVGEVVHQFSRADALRLLAGRFLQRLADVVAAEASKLLSRVELAASVIDREAAGAVAGEAQFALTVLEPAVVFREMASNVAAVATAGPRRYGAVPIIDRLPEAVHTRVGVSLRLRASAGAGDLTGNWGDRVGWPDADITLDLFQSLGALAVMAGRDGVRSLERLSLGWDGFARSPARLIPHTDVDRNDRVDVFAATLRSLVGHRLLLTEVMASPPGRDAHREYVEVYNPGFAEVLLDGWALRDTSGRSFAFPAGTRIAPGAFLIVARSLEGFWAAYGQLPAVGTLTLALNDNRDTLELLNAEGWATDRVEWGAAGSERLVPSEGGVIARRGARVPPSALPGSAFQWTGSLLDFGVESPSPGRVG